MKIQQLESLLQPKGGWVANHARDCVKTPGVKFGNDPIFAVSDFDEMSRRIEWSEIEFSHSLALQRTRWERRGYNPCVPCAGLLSLGR